ncbi:MAG: GGDEF domain-containing protein [Minwuia sp.]|uniref:GGDEF domain-containing protein n=1 Tax=Minwuia sp. TaxID=2493630 RepID=UPI003A8393D6
MSRPRGCTGNPLMLYELDNKNDARRYADTAIQLIESYDINSTPDFFRLFYDYASERDPVVCSTLREVSDETPEVFRRTAEDLLFSHYGEDRQFRMLTETGEAMQDEIMQVCQQVANAGDDVGQFGSALDGLENGLGSIEGGVAIKTLVAQMLVATRQMRVKSEQLEQDLKQSANEISNLQDKLAESRKEALTDVLTGLTNRAGFDRSLQRHCENAAASGDSLTLVMCDIDHFKRFNDTYGHQLGDQVLRLVGGVLHDGLKGRDVPCRYGGEEFALILPETDLEGGRRVAENVRQAISSKRIVRKSTGEEIARVTMSFGVSQYRTGELPASLVGRADAALYQAKTDGRNRVNLEPFAEPPREAAD